MIRTLLLTLSLFLALPSVGKAESAADVIDRMMDAEAGYYAGIDNMFSLSRSMGHRVPEYFEWDGGYWRSVPLAELMEREQPNEMSQASPDQLRHAASILRQESARVDAAVQQEIAESGGICGSMGTIITMASNPPEQWLTSSPGGMMNLYATMLDAGADAKKQMAEERTRDRNESFENLELIEAIKSQMRIVGRSKLGGYPVIERTDSTFMGGDNCGDLLRPRKSVMRLKGGMSPEQTAELEAARQQLASLPPEQREMMKRMMGKQQFEMIKNTASGGGIEMVTDVLELRCNSEPPTAAEIATMLQ